MSRLATDRNVSEQGTPAASGARAEGRDRRVSLRPVTTSDYDWIYSTSLSEATSYRWRTRGATPSPEAFVQHLWNAVLCQFILEASETKERLGLSQCYNADFRNGHAYISVLLAEEFRSRAWPLEGVFRFLDYVFATFGFRKLYFETPGFNIDQFASAIGRYLKEEGRLRDHEIFNGTYHDLYFLALYRDDWDTDIRGRFL